MNIRNAVYYEQFTKKIITLSPPVSESKIPQSLLLLHNDDWKSVIWNIGIIIQSLVIMSSLWLSNFIFHRSQCRSLESSTSFNYYKGIKWIHKFSAWYMTLQYIQTVTWKAIGFLDANNNDRQPMLITNE